MVRKPLIRSLPWNKIRCANIKVYVLYSILTKMDTQRENNKNEDRFALRKKIYIKSTKKTQRKWNGKRRAWCKTLYKNLSCFQMHTFSAKNSRSRICCLYFNRIDANNDVNIIIVCDFFSSSSSSFLEHGHSLLLDNAFLSRRDRDSLNLLNWNKRKFIYI